MNIENPKFLKALNTKELTELASEIRSFIIEKVSVTGGHLSSNLGAVELIIAIHKVFDSPNDKIIFDVGHQAYTHKILTGRANQFDMLRPFNGLS
jgi:1-deoxy-D-xylulose-5-phosphate synthase